ECGRHQRGCAVDVWDLGLGDPLCLHATLLQALILLRPYPGERLRGIFGAHQRGDLRLV
ncbi:unnamed protein product, partial [Effrenium voratum]